VPGRANHRQRLLRGARRCLHEKGYARTTARDIAAASGSNLGSIGYHFGSKQALLKEAIREGCAEWTDQIAALAFADGGATPIERLHASWAALTETFEKHRPLLVAFLEALAEAGRSEEMRRQLANLYEESRVAVGRMVQESLGEAKIGENRTLAVASFLIAVCEGLLLQRLADPQRAPSGDDVIAGLEAVLPLAVAGRAVTPDQAQQPS
jgi:AcrR family transcriptional regulator